MTLFLSGVLVGLIARTLIKSVWDAWGPTVMEKVRGMLR